MVYRIDSVAKPLWWCGITLSSFLLLSFLLFGVYIFTISFSLNNPLIFIALFFSSSLMIMVCLSLMAGIIVKVVVRLRGRHLKSPIA